MNMYTCRTLLRFSKNSLKRRNALLSQCYCSQERSQNDDEDEDAAFIKRFSHDHQRQLDAEHGTNPRTLFRQAQKLEADNDNDDDLFIKRLPKKSHASFRPRPPQKFMPDEIDHEKDSFFPKRSERRGQIFENANNANQGLLASLIENSKNLPRRSSFKTRSFDNCLICSGLPEPPGDADPVADFSTILDLASAIRVPPWSITDCRRIGGGRLLRIRFSSKDAADLFFDNSKELANSKQRFQRNLSFRKDYTETATELREKLQGSRDTTTSKTTTDTAGVMNIIKKNESPIRASLLYEDDNMSDDEVAIAEETVSRKSFADKKLDDHYAAVKDRHMHNLKETVSHVSTSKRRNDEPSNPYVLPNTRKDDDEVHDYYNTSDDAFIKRLYRTK